MVGLKFLIAHFCSGYVLRTDEPLKIHVSLCDEAGSRTAICLTGLLNTCRVEKKFFLSFCMLPKRSSILGSSSFSLQTSQGHLCAAITTTPSTLHCYGQELQGVHQDRTEVIKVI